MEIFDHKRIHLKRTQSLGLLLFIDSVDEPLYTFVKSFLAEGGASLNVPCAIRNVHKLEVLHN